MIRVHMKRTAGSADTHTAKGQMPKNRESCMNPAEIKLRPIVSLIYLKNLISHRKIKTRGSQNQRKVESSVVEEKVCLYGKTCENRSF